MIKVLIVEDSIVVSTYLEHIITSDPDLKVIGVVRNGIEAMEFISKEKPDLITMDIDMPLMNGLEATREIMAEFPIPIIIVTASRNANETAISMEALSAGALTLLEKPEGPGHPRSAESARRLINMIKTYSEVKVITRKRMIPPSKKMVRQAPQTMVEPPVNGRTRIVAIGASSGGPKVLQRILSGLTANFPYPIVIVQHITSGFLPGMVKWLQNETRIPIIIPRDKELLLPGTVYFAPDGYRLELTGSVVTLTPCIYNPVTHCPSVAALFGSLCTFQAKDTIAILLTGMGSDGSAELKQLLDKGAMTIAQDEESSLVFGMPGEAVKLGGAQMVINPDEIAEFLMNMEKEAVQRNKL